MKKINLKIRFKNPLVYVFLLSIIISTIFIISIFLGYEVEFIKNKLIEIVLAIIAVISSITTAFLGLVDFTTPKIEDSLYTQSKTDLKQSIDLTVDELQKIEKTAINDVEKTQKILYNEHIMFEQENIK